MNKEETRKLYEQGKDAWNAWASGMLVKRAEMEKDGTSELDRRTGWFAEATANFEDHSFDQYANFNSIIFPADARFRGARFSKGQAAAELLAELPEGAVVLADKAYDADAIRALIEAQGAAPNIPARSTRKARFCFSRTLYKARNRIERLFNKLKQFRRVATRYDKLAATFTAMIKLACVRLWLRGYESTA